MIDGTGLFTLRQEGDAADLLLTSAMRVTSVRDVAGHDRWCDRRFRGGRVREGSLAHRPELPCFVESRVVVTEVGPGPKQRVSACERAT